MYYYKIIIQYSGSNYAGFQWQAKIKTVQSDINYALEKIIDGKFSTTASSRTDTGVHAVFQVLKLTCVKNIEQKSFLEILNKALPKEIRALEIDPCPGIFRPASGAISKEYRYFFVNKTQVKKEDSQFISNIANKLNIELIKECINALPGEHDFCNFYSAGSNVKNTIRTIYQCELSEVNPHEIFLDSVLFIIPKEITSCYQIKITGNGFLKQMIRKFVSALWLVGSSKMSKDEFLQLLNGPQNQTKQLKVAPPNGLFLFHVSYKL